MKRVVDTLLLNLQALMPGRGSGEWEGSACNMIDLLREISKAEEPDLPILTKVDFLECPHFEEPMLYKTKAVCRSVGVALEYTSYGSNKS